MHFETNPTVQSMTKLLSPSINYKNVDSSFVKEIPFRPYSDKYEEPTKSHDISDKSYSYTY